MFNVKRIRIDRNKFSTFRFFSFLFSVRPSVKIDDETIYSSIDDEIQLNCFIDGNPRPDIRWFHRFSPADDDDREEEMDFSTNFHSINFEQLNSTRWKTSLLINVKKRKRCFLFLNEKKVSFVFSFSASIRLFSLRF